MEEELREVLSQFFEVVEVRKESIPELGSLKVKLEGLDRVYTLRFVKMGGKLRLWRVTDEEPDM